ncbi:hypothetical protein ACJX0J_030510, partial [Zea mays]
CELKCLDGLYVFLMAFRDENMYDNFQAKVSLFSHGLPASIFHHMYYDLPRRKFGLLLAAYVF